MTDDSQTDTTAATAKKRGRTCPRAGSDRAQRLPHPRVVADLDAAAALATKATAKAADVEARIEALLASLRAELESVEGEASAFLKSAKSHAVNLVLHVNSLFDWQRKIDAEAATKNEPAV